MTGFEGSLDQPAPTFKFPQIIKNLWQRRMAHPTAKPAAISTPKTLSESDKNGNMLASRILEAERDIAIAQITGKDLDQRLLEALFIPKSRRNKIKGNTGTTTK
jgi:hypothetical protein